MAATPPHAVCEPVYDDSTAPHMLCCVQRAYYEVRVLSIGWVHMFGSCLTLEARAWYN
jgi:hypothetical protein